MKNCIISTCVVGFYCCLHYFSYSIFLNTLISLKHRLTTRQKILVLLIEVRFFLLQHKIYKAHRSVFGKFIKEYSSIREAERQTGVTTANIRKALRNERNSAGGFV